MRKLKRDKVISIADGKDLVGVYFADTDGSEALLECSPEKANKIIAIWNEEKYQKQFSGKEMSEVFTKIREDLEDICEDNEVMKESINDYFQGFEF